MWHKASRGIRKGTPRFDNLLINLKTWPRKCTHTYTHEHTHTQTHTATQTHTHEHKICNSQLHEYPKRENFIRFISFKLSVNYDYCKSCKIWVIIKNSYHIFPDFLTSFPRHQWSTHSTTQNISQDADFRVWTNNRLIRCQSIYEDMRPEGVDRV